MSTANELLREAMGAMRWANVCVGPNELCDDIENFLAAKPEAKPKTWQGLKMHEVASLWSEALDPAYFARAIEQALKEKNTRPEPARKPMTSEEMEKQYEIDKEYFGESVMRAFYNGVRFAEKHHGIGGDDE
jgi:hypothetical protein